jgi:hypothetical protein
MVQPTDDVISPDAEERKTLDLMKDDVLKTVRARLQLVHGLTALPREQAIVDTLVDVMVQLHLRALAGRIV